MSALIIPYVSSMNQELRDIFFESSTKKDFENDAAKEAFYYKYLGFYLEHLPEYAWVAKDENILGYVVASPQSSNPDLIKLQPHLESFKQLFQNYPGHLHINCHAAARGKGIGGKLVSKVEDQLKSQNINGLHVMTGPDSLNKSFYRKLGLTYEFEGTFNGIAILFMGKSL